MYSNALQARFYHGSNHQSAPLEQSDLDSTCLQLRLKQEKELTTKGVIGGKSVKGERCRHCFFYAESQIKMWNVWIFCASSVKCSKLISSADHQSLMVS